MTDPIVKLSFSQPLLGENLTAEQRFRRWLNRATAFETASGKGSPEGLLSASERKYYFDEDDGLGALYFKTVDRLNNDSKQGWQIVARFSGNGELIVETDIDYQIVLGNKFINCSGILNITAITIAQAIDEVTITAVDGACTFLADATIQGGGAVPLGTSTTFYPAREQWFRK